MCDADAMIYIVTNAVAIIVATLCSLGVGLACVRAAPRRRPRAGAGGAIAVIFLAELWLCAILAGALILAPPRGGVWTMTLGTAFIIWIGFVLPTIVAGHRHRALGWRTIAADGGHGLAVMLVQAVVLRLIGLTPPA